MGSPDDSLRQRLYDLPLIRTALTEQQQLPATLHYHVPAHIVDVLDEVLLFGGTDGLTARDLELLALGAAFHDYGFLHRLKDNEVVGAAAAVAAMRGAGGYSADEISGVETMILDTKVHLSPAGPRQIPTTSLSGYLCDADVSNLGRDDFLEKAELVRREVGAEKDRTFFENLRTFLRAHRWHTPAGRALRQAGKDRNLARLDKMLASSHW